MAPLFKAKGYCVFALNYGSLNELPLIYGLDRMENSAQQLSDFVDKVLAATGSTKVDLLGHSQGTLMPQYYLKRLNGASKVEKFAGFGSIQYGTTAAGLQPLLAPLGLFDVGSQLNVSTEVLVTPYTSGYLRTRSSNVRNQLLQDCHLVQRNPRVPLLV
ncbi:hypothetical protein EC968_008532 [Mortierella alpina]|nr:hypothetical protein EC968_008532 [Mortierella alpina]